MSQRSLTALAKGLAVEEILDRAVLGLNGYVADKGGPRSCLNVLVCSFRVQMWRTGDYENAMKHALGSASHHDNYAEVAPRFREEMDAAVCTLRGIAVRTDKGVLSFGRLSVCQWVALCAIALELLLATGGTEPRVTAEQVDLAAERAVRNDQLFRRLTPETRRDARVLVSAFVAQGGDLNLLLV